MDDGISSLAPVPPISIVFYSLISSLSERA